MSTAVTRRKKISFYTEPYYIPGYAAYFSQLPFQIGDTYGHITNRLLTDPEISKSNRTVLVDTDKIEDHKDEECAKTKWIRRRNKSWGGIKLNEAMVPGYTGYIPRSEEHFGSRYAEICDRAALDHGIGIEKYYSKREDVEKNMRQSLPPIRAEAESYVPRNAYCHYISPYFQEPDEPEKTFMSGYTGYIPKSRSGFALGYPIATNEALVSFTKDQKGHKEREGKPVVVERPYKLADISTVDMHVPIYTCPGLLPHYTGYLPGHKFRYGLTYGSSSRYHHCDKYFCKGRVPYKF